MRAHLANDYQFCEAEQPSLVIVCVDDTDDETRAISTGEIASHIAREAVALGGAMRLETTRHQLLLRDDVPYTSHNSSMAFEVLLPADRVAELRERAIDVIVRNRAATSDPGLCVATLPWGADAPATGEDVRAVERVIAFGNRAKVDFCSKESAYEIAASIPWVTLSEHGGDGVGVVGALAGVGLRLGGNDGRFRGKWNFERLCAGEPVLDVAAVTARLARDFRGPVALVSSDGDPLDPHMPFAAEAEGKPVLFAGALTVVCDVEDGVAHPCKKVDLGEIGNVSGSWARVCDAFEWDNDLEECPDREIACANCLHRRWVRDGFLCMCAASSAAAV